MGDTLVCGSVAALAQVDKTASGPLAGMQVPQE